MKWILTIGVVGIIGLVAYRLLETLSPDALGMGVGVFLGLIASIPAALLVVVGGQRRRKPTYRDSYGVERYQRGHMSVQPQTVNIYYGDQRPARQQEWERPRWEEAPRPSDRPRIGSQPTGLAYPHMHPVGHNQRLPARQQLEAREFRIVGEEDGWL